ncbi:hypothetical protein D3C78_1911880 [compost metagenome]
MLFRLRHDVLLVPEEHIRTVAMHAKVPAQSINMLHRIVDIGQPIGAVELRPLALFRLVQRILSARIAPE